MWISINDEHVAPFIEKYGQSEPGSLERNIADKFQHYVEISACEKRTAYLTAAAEHATDGELEFDEDAVISYSEDGGAYVMGWYWINDPSHD